MILITGGTGFIGSELTRQLNSLQKPYRLLIQPSKNQNYLPRNIDVEVVLSSLTDERGVKAALQGIDTIYHLTGMDFTATQTNIPESEISGTEVLSRVAADAGVGRFFYLSHLGADRASAYQMMKVKGIAEHTIRNSGLNYTILRCGLVFGKGDSFIYNLSRLIRSSPGIVLLPGEGKTLLQPLWIDDLINSLIWSLDLPNTINQVIEIGGPEQITFLELMQQIADSIKRKRKFVEFNPVQLGLLTQILESVNHNFPTSMFWLEYLAENRTCDLDSMSRNFRINPARFCQKLDYLTEKTY